jgi:transcription elongation factor GreA
MDWENLKNNLKKRFHRTKGTDFEDQPNARMQVRWLYACLMDELRRRGKYNRALTPNEQARTQFPAQENAYQLTELYNRARYSEQDIHEEEALSGRKYLEEMLKNVVLIDESGVHTDAVNIGTTVKIFNRTMNMEKVYHLVGSTEANAMENKISDHSPIGNAIIGAKVGETVKVETMRGVMELEILEISK